MRALIQLLIPFLVSVGAGYFGLYYAMKGDTQACGDTKTISMAMMKKGQGFLATAVDSHANNYMIFVNSRTGEWTILRSPRVARKICPYMRGTDWQFIMDKVRR